MPEFLITAPDGKKYRVSGPNRQGALEALKRKLAAPIAASNTPRPVLPQPQPQQPPVPASEKGDISMGTAFDIATAQAESAATGGLAAFQRLLSEGAFGKAQKYLTENYGNPAREFVGLPPVDIEARNKAEAERLQTASDTASGYADRVGEETGFYNMTTGDINSLSDFVNFVGQKGAQAGAYMAPSLASGAAPISMGLNYAFGTGEISSNLKEIEGKTQEEKDQIAASGGAIVAALEQLGIAKLLPAGASNSIIGGIASGVVTEGTTEGLQELVNIGAERVAGKQFTEGEILERLKEAAAAGGVVGGTFKGGTTAAVKVQGIFRPDGTFDPSALTNQEKLAGADVARILQSVVQKNGYNLKDLDVSSEKGAKKALEAVRRKIISRIDEITKNKEIKKYFNSATAKSLGDIDLYAEANGGIKAAKNKVADRVTQSQINAIRRLMPPTQEAQELLNLMAMSNVTTDLFNRGMKGGISRYTDYFNPLIKDGSYDPSRMANIAVGTGSALTLGPTATAGIVAGGRAVDAITGRRAVLDRFLKKNVNKEGLANPVGPSLLALKELQKKLEQQQLDASKQETLELNRALYDEGIEPAGLDGTMDKASPEAQMMLALEVNTPDGRFGPDRTTINSAVQAIIDNPDSPKALVKAAETYLTNIRDGGKIPKLTPLIQAVKREINSNPEVYGRTRASQLSQGPAFARTVAQPAQPAQQEQSPAYQAGIQRNIDRVDNQKLLLNANPTIPAVEKAQLNASLDRLRKPLTSPVVAVQQEVQRLNELGVDPASIDLVLSPIQEAVTSQQRQAQGLQQPTIEDDTKFDMEPPALEGFEGYLSRVNPQGTRIAAEERPNLMMGDMYGMLPRGSEIVSERDDGITFHRSPDGDYFATAYNPDVGEQDVVGYITDRGNSTELQVVAEMQNRGIGGELQYMFRSENPDAPTGGLTEAGEAALSRTYDRLFDEGLVDDREPPALQMPEIVRGETTNIMMPNDLGSAFTFARDNNFRTGRDLKLQLQQRSLDRQKEEGIDLTQVNEENVPRLADHVFNDAIEALKNNENAIGWYDRTVTKALETLGEIYPEILTNPENKLQFIWALAVTSNGTKVDKNFELAADAYDHLQRTGRFPAKIGIGDAAKQIDGGLAQYHTLLTKFQGNHQALADFMISQLPVRDVEQQYGVKISGEGKGTIVRGASILGPKIGNGFFSNLYGHFDALTMDRWLMRTVGRMRGTLVKINKPMIKQKQGEIGQIMKDASPEQMKQLRAIFKPLGVKVGKNLSIDEKNYLSAVIAKQSTNEKWRNNLNGVSRDLRLVGNALAKYLDGQVEAPAGAKERDFIREVFKQALDRLNDDPRVSRISNAGLTMSDLQALLWYPEKRLYDTAKAPAGEESRGYSDDEAPDYANAARKLVEARKANSSGSGLGPAGSDGSGGRGPALADAGRTVDDREPGLLPALREGRDKLGAKFSRRPQRQEVVDQFPPVKALFEIGKKGSPYENGITNLDQALALARALNITVHLFHTQQQMMDAQGRKNTGTVRGSFRKTPNGASGTVFALKEHTRVNDGRVSKLDELTTVLHEIFHGVTMGPMSGVGPMLNGNGNGTNSVENALGAMIDKPQGKRTREEREIIYEVKRLQDQLTAYIEDNPRDRRSVRVLNRALQNLEENRMRMTPEQQMQQEQAIDNYKNYIRTKSEFSVDPFWVYAVNPKLAKQVMPVTTKWIQKNLRKAGNKDIQFYSHPFAVSVAVMLAILAAEGGEQEEQEQQQPGALSPMPGMLTAA